MTIQQLKSNKNTKGIKTASLAVLLSLMAGCSSSSTEQSVSLKAAAAAIDSSTRSLTTRGITITLSGVLAASQLQDGRWEVSPETYAGVLVVSHTTTSGTIGSVINSPGKAATEVQTQSAIGKRVTIGDVLLVASTFPGSPNCNEMTAIHVVPWLPSPDHIVGPALGAPNIFNKFLRTNAPIGPLDLSRLPSIVNIDSLPVAWGQFGKGKPTFEWMESQIGFLGDVGDSWGLTAMPTAQVNSYGRNLACRVSQALVMCCSTAPAEQKRKLATRLVQNGMDVLGAFLDGRTQEVDGGHYQGRKALIVFSLHMLGIPENLWPIVLQNQFQEDLAYGDLGPLAWQPSWRYGWRGRHRNRHYWNLSPSQWDDNQREKWYVLNYCHGNVGPQIGTALAMQLLGLQHHFGAMTGFVGQWMTGPNAAGIQALSAAGITGLPWGKDFSFDKAEDFCAAAWVKYHK